MKWLRGLSSAEAGDERLEGIFRLFSKDLRRYVRRRIRHPADAADLTQEIFERFVRSDRRIRAQSPHAYLFGIASHVVAEARMAEQRNKVTFDSALLDQAAESLPDGAAAHPENLALEEEIAHALERLSDMQRAALLLTKRDGLSCKEAAIRMRTTEGSVRVYVCEARARLKVLLRRGR